MPEKGAIKIGPFGSALKKHEYSAAGIRVLGIEDVMPNRLTGTKPKFIPQAKYEQLSQYTVKAGDVLVTNMGTVGRACVVPPDLETSIISSHLIKVSLEEDKVYPPYVCWALNCAPSVVAQIVADSHGAIMAGFNSGLLRKLRIPLPPLAQQRRVAEVLDRAEALRAKRRAAIAHLDALTHSIFLDMFGDDRTYDSVDTTVAGVADARRGAIRTGPFGSQLLHSEFRSSGVAVLGIDNAVDNEFKWGKPRYISTAKYRALERYTVHPGDVLITIMGTCGRCAIVPDDIPPAINTKHLCCISLDRSQCLPGFLQAYFLIHPVARRYLEERAKGAVMDGLNMGLIKDMPLRLPSLRLQQLFVDCAAAVTEHRAMLHSSLVGFDALFASLQHRAFRGEL